MLVIRKQPSDKYLQNQTFCLSQSEFNSMFNGNIDTQIQVFDQNRNLVKIIEELQYKSLQLTKRTGFDEDGNATGEYFIADFGYVDFEPVKSNPVKSDVVQLVGPINVYATRASMTDAKYSITYRTKQITDQVPFNFIDGNYYIIEFSTGDLIKFRASRGGDTLFSGKLPKKPVIKTPNKTGIRILHTIDTIHVVR